MTNSTTLQPVCAITGGSSGIGLATAVRFAEAGYRVAICGRDEARLAAAALRISGGEVAALACDLAQPRAGREFVSEVLRHWERIDVLVNNAGAAVMAPLEEISSQEFEQMVSVNVAATFDATQRAWTAMKAAGGGTVINIASQSARDPFPGFSVYGGCKAWVTTFSKAIAGEGRTANIRVYAVLPGAVETPMLRSVLPDLPAENTLAAADVAETVYALTLPPWRHASGSCIDVVK